MLNVNKHKKTKLGEIYENNKGRTLKTQWLKMQRNEKKTNWSRSESWKSKKRKGSRKKKGKNRKKKWSRRKKIKGEGQRV